jgi:hypothetical protein
MIAHVVPHRTGWVRAFAYVIALVYTSSEVWAAATPGKLLLRLRIMQSDCTAADGWRLCLRWSTKWSWLGLSFCSCERWAPLYILAGFLSSLCSSAASSPQTTTT